MLAMIGIAGVARLAGVRRVLVHDWWVDSPPRIGDTGWQGELRWVGHDRDTGLRRTPISKQGYLAAGWGPIVSCHRTRLSGRRAADGLRGDRWCRWCRWCRAGVIARRSRGREGGRVRRKEWQYEPHDKGNASKK